MKLFWKIYIAVFISFAGVIALIVYVTSAKQLADAENRIVDEHIIIGSFISKDIERGQAEARWPFENLTKLSEHGDFLFWWIVEKNGTIHLADKASFIGTSAYGYFPQLASIKVDGNAALNRKKDCGIFIKSFGTEKNRRAFWLGFSTSEVSRIKRRILISAAASSAFALTALGLALYFTVNYFTKPIKKLAEGAAVIGMGELNHRVDVRSEDELGYLAYCFNDMAAKLKESYAHLEEKVQQRTVDLALANTKLEQEVVERKLAQVKLQRHIKQLNCLYDLSRLAVRPQISLDQIFQETAKLVRGVYRYPDITCVRITFNGIQYKTDNFKKTEISQHADIRIRGERVGSIEVYCLQERPDGSEGPFIEEEHALLDAVSEKLSRIAELKQTTDKLQLFRNLIEQSNDCIFVLEPKWGRFLDANETACRTFGYTREELLNVSIKDVEQSTENGTSQQENTKELKLKTDIIKQGKYRRRDGTTFWAETSLKPVSREGEEYVIAVARDITERKQAEERQARLVEELEDANQELKDFAHIVSHDLKAPLCGIRTVAEWISADYADKLDEKGREQLGMLMERVERMYKLIDGVLAYSRVGRLKEKRIQVNLNELVRSIIDSLAVRENISIVVENELPVLECEETRITQVFQNLMSNAVKYMDKPEGQIRISCIEENGHWKFGVADNGPGIEEKDFERIFKIFQTASQHKTAESTGIGLSIVKKVVELYGGKIWVESKVGEGSTFFFTLPKREVEVKNANCETCISC